MMFLIECASRRIVLRGGRLGRCKRRSSRSLKLSGGDPEIPQRFSIMLAGLELIALCREQLKCSDNHAVVMELRLFKHFFFDRH